MSNPYYIDKYIHINLYVDMYTAQELMNSLSNILKLFVMKIIYILYECPPAINTCICTDRNFYIHILYTYLYNYAASLYASAARKFIRKAREYNEQNK